MKVSIIIACYNQEAYLSETLDSVLKQTYSNWECIIIDDGSTDNSAKIAKEYSYKYSNIKYLYQENQGVCIARNNAIKQSIGKYILCLDADDKISPQYISLCVNELDQDQNVSLVTCNYQYFGKLNKKIYLKPYSIERLMGCNLFINCSMFRRTDYDKSNGFNNNMHLGYEDWDFWLSILKNGGKVVYLDGIHFFYRIKTKNESRNLSTAAKNQDILRKQIWMNHLDLYSNVYSSPLYSMEYILLKESKEYKLGRMLLKPLRWFLKRFRN